MQLASLLQLPGHEADVPLQTSGEQDGVPALPAVMLVQLPSVPVRLHASQAPPQAALQQ